MKYILISTAIPEPIYYLVDRVDSDGNGMYGVELKFYCYNKIKLKKLYNLLYNIKEGKFYRFEPSFRVHPFKNEEALNILHQYGLANSDKTLYEISLNIENNGDFDNCFTIAKRLGKRTSLKFSFTPIFNEDDRSKKLATMRLQKYFTKKS